MGIISKPKYPELSSLFATHCLDMIKASVKFHEYSRYGLGVMARARMFITHVHTHVRTDGQG